MFLAHITRFGILRSALLLLGMMLALLAPEPQTRTVTEWPLIIPTLIAPALIPLVVMAILLDMMMSAIFSSGADKIEEKHRYRNIIIINAIVVAIIIFRWLTFFTTLGPA